MDKKFTLSVLPEKLAICHLGKNSPIPSWTNFISFCSITRTKDELSIICPQDVIPGGILFEADWRAFQVQGPLGFTMTGVVSSLSGPLAKVGISIFYVDTYETSYVLIEEKNLAKAIEVLSQICEIKQ